ncbi:M1 family metallopeptidase [Robertkochia flava]|uniref:M1 family metallopeptidase n=1 Tax=Robertkochia flava TaxID=3447986 RepID=UPI001CCD9716|nr:M1 family metallopeptidase [Robertkochia marina]
MKQFLLYFSLLFSVSFFAQNGDAVDFTEGKINIAVNPAAQEIAGEVLYNFRVLKPVDSILLSSRNLDILKVTFREREIGFRTYNKSLVLDLSLDRGRYKGLKIIYKAHPESAVYFPGWRSGYPSEDNLVVNGEGGRQVWTQGQGKYTSSWVPSFDDMNEKVRFSLDVRFPRDYQVIANGELRKVVHEKDESIWQYEMKNPVSSYLLAFVGGLYDKREIRSSSGVPIHLYYYPSDSSRVEATYRYTRQIFDFLEKETGVPYPWVNYKQVPVRDFLYAGMENVTLTIFSDNYITDSRGFTDRNYVNVNAHELAHHWFGNLVTEESGKHHWLQEGFATYYALLTEKMIFGEDHYYWKLYGTARQLIALSDNTNGESLLDPEAGSLTFYEKGAWALHILRERMGEMAFREGIKAFLNAYAFKNATTEDLLEVLSGYTEVNLQEFRETWLEQPEFPAAEAIQSLKRNAFIARYMEIEEDNAPPVVLFNESKNALKSDSFYPLKQLITERSAYWPRRYRDSLWLYALKEGDGYVRAGVAKSADSIGVTLKQEFELLLEDPSYITVQEALMKLWIEYPEDRSRYLRETEALIGFEDHSLRMLWLALALFTFDDPELTQRYFGDLTAYTGPGYPFDTRQQAFNMLYEIGGFTRASYLNLMQGMHHPAWQFSRFCKSMMDRLLSNPETRIQIRSILPDLKSPLKDTIETRMEAVISGTK